MRKVEMKRDLHLFLCVVIWQVCLNIGIHGFVVDDSGRCDDGWTLWGDGDRCYYLSDTTSDAEAAYHFCKNDMASSLISIENYYEWKYINHNLRTGCLVQGQPSRCDEESVKYWVGIYRQVMAGPEVPLWDRLDEYIWVDGSPYTRASDFYLWGHGRSQPSPNTQCAFLDYSGYLTGEHCIKDYRYICEKVARPKTTTTSTTTTTTQPEVTTAELSSLKTERIIIPMPSEIPSLSTASITKGLLNICVLCLILVTLRKIFEPDA